jgi:hypothetical protein
MKKIFFLFALLASMTASAAVTVTPLGVNYGTKTVTFRVSWGTAANNRVWVWVDLCPVTGTSPGTFAKAVISGAAATAGSIATVSGNTRGFYVTTNPSTVTATLSNATGQFNWCAYGSDYPPNVTASGGTYTLHGSPPFTLIAANGTTTQTVAATAIATSAVTITPVTLTDETGYPGIFCIYTGSDLYIDATHLCQQRTSGAKNWEAYIKDSRDNQIYRITQFSDNSWWFAEDFNIALNVKHTCGGKRYYSYKDSPDCPASWKLPTKAQIINRWACPPTNDNYGGSMTIGAAAHPGDLSCWENCGGRYDLLPANPTTTGAYACYPYAYANCPDAGSWRENQVTDAWGRIRCFRQL